MTKSTNTTYIIPIRIESKDRERNVLTSIVYLLKHTDGNILIKEFSENQLLPKVLGDTINDKRINYLYEKGSGVFHRTRFLNDMLELVETPIVCNYDADVILPYEAYKQSENLILSGAADVVYPYPHSATGQVQLFLEKDDKFPKSLNVEDIFASKWRLCSSHAGFCVFVRTKDYIKAGGEHEGFVSYGPEDGERILRLEKMGLTVKRLDKSVIFHMEHTRTQDSSGTNPYFTSNYQLYDKLTNMSRQELVNHLKQQPYLTKRSWEDKVR